MNSVENAAAQASEVDQAPLIEIDDVAVHFGGVKAVDGVTMRLRPGLIYGIIGANGSGKSTLFGAISRLVPLTRGSLRFDGVPFDRQPAYKIPHLGIARSFQTVRLLEDRTVRDNIRLGHDAVGKASRSVIEQRVTDVLTRLALDEVAEVYPDALSYGIQRRVEIARAIVSQPRLLLLDEPTAGMNGPERDEVSELMLALKGEGITQFLVEHDVQMMVDTCDYLFAMNMGKLIAEGPPQSVVEDAEVRRSYMGGSADA
ncbi:ABC transporter ATP-binding protein [Microbacterium sp. NPDC055910]|uniref:ABC transporter ATP-binding protein n=1 Tax=Microbacterium sp. NPDC055910 TaxID=3345659 RepID=UPI0035E1E01A